MALCTGCLTLVVVELGYLVVVCRLREVDFLDEPTSTMLFTCYTFYPSPRCRCVVLEEQIGAEYGHNQHCLSVVLVAEASQPESTVEIPAKPLLILFPILLVSEVSCTLEAGPRLPSSQRRASSRRMSWRGTGRALACPSGRSDR